MSEPSSESRTREPVTIAPAEWVDRHGDSLFRFAILRVHDRQVAEDLVQDTFVAALQGGRKQVARAGERTWLIGILKHKIVDHLRREGRRQDRNKTVPQGELESFFTDRGLWKETPPRWRVSEGRLLENQEFWEALRQCLAQLSPLARSIFSLREIEQLSTEEVCAVLEISSANLWTQNHRARLQLRHCLEHRWFAPRRGARP